MRILTAPLNVMLVLLLLTPPPGLTQCQSQPDTSPTHLIGTGSCGSTTWQVGYTYKSNTTILFYQYSPAGTCGGDDYQCDCSYKSYYQLQGNVTVSSILTQEDGYNGYDLKWISTQDNPIQRVACTEGYACCTNANDATPTMYKEQIAEDFVIC